MTRRRRLMTLIAAGLAVTATSQAVGTPTALPDLNLTVMPVAPLTAGTTPNYHTSAIRCWPMAHPLAFSKPLHRAS
jgi:hypothetical protein